MKNKTVKMILAVVVLGVCCGAYAGVKTYVAHQEKEESKEEAEESTTVFTASTDNIKSLNFMVDDTETTFEKDNDSWVKKDETDFPVFWILPIFCCCFMWQSKRKADGKI